jgi:hypothetical protein
MTLLTHHVHRSTAGCLHATAVVVTIGVALSRMAHMIVAGCWTINLCNDLLSLYF